MSKTTQSRPDFTLKAAEILMGLYNSLEGDMNVAYRDFKSLVTMPMPSILDPDFPDKYRAAECMSKFPFDIDVDREAVAIDAFRASEKACAAFNSVSPWFGPYRTPAVFRRAARKIHSILGDFSWDEAARWCDFGPGSTTSLPRVKGHAFYKFGGIPDVTFKCLPVATYVLENHYPLYWGHLVRNSVDGPSVGKLAESVRVVKGSKLTTVPKNAKTDRVICIEPDLNMFCQKGIGGLIRKRLKKIGLNLNVQQQVNRRMAQVASATGALATIDLSAASDSVSLGLCETLLPPDWFNAMMAVRSDTCVLPDRTEHPLEKVSSMGNGFTFELESLIFLALAWAVNPKLDLGVSLAVYGDDIIVPVADAGPLIRALDLAGFKTNQKKTFVEGPFKESCGKHYFYGEDCTPIYIRKPVDSLIRLFWFANSLLRHSLRDGWRDRSYEIPWMQAVSLIPERNRLPIPDGVGDGGLVVAFDEACPQRARRGIEGWIFHHYVERRETFDIDGPAALLTSLRQLEGLHGDTEYTPGVPNPRFSRLRRVPSLTPQWTAIGPWY